MYPCFCFNFLFFTGSFPAEPVSYLFSNLLLFTVAPKSTSADLLSLSVKDASTTPHSYTDADLLRPLSTDAPDAAVTSSGSAPDATVTSSGPKPEISELKLGNLTVSVSSADISLGWSAPEEAFDSFLLEVRAPSGATPIYTATLPGHVRNAEIEGLSPSTQYDITLQGLVEGNRSLPLKVLATTGT